MSIRHDRKALGFRDPPAYRPRRPRTGANRHVVFAACFIAALLLLTVLS